MKIVAIGDIHGRTIWKKIVDKEKADKVVFIGDYFDTHEDVSAEQQKQNFEDIIRYKEQNGDSVILLTGNHDFHYLSAVGQHYSGYQAYHAQDIEEMVASAIGLGYMQMCYVQDGFIFVHAGFTKTWCRNIIRTDMFINGQIFMETINDLFRHQPKRFVFTPGEFYDTYGDEVEQSPIWVRPKSLKRDKLDGFTQVAGYTTQKHIMFDKGVWLIDALANRQYLSIVNGKAQTERVK